VVGGGCEEEAVVEGLVVEHLIPALYALLMDGLNPFTSSFFGRLKNNVWSIVELTGKQGIQTLHINYTGLNTKDCSLARDNHI
jgi:hypothetical protein